MSWILHCLMLLTILGAQATTAKLSFPYELCENDKSYYTANSTYHANLNQALSRLIQSADNDLHGGNYGFYNSSYGKNNSDKVYMAGLCRGDAEPNTCRRCLHSSSHFLSLVCPKEKEAFGGFDQCMLRYSNRSFFGLMESRPRFRSWSDHNVSFNYTDGFLRNLRSRVGTLLSDLNNRASAGSALRKYATGNISTGLEFLTIYAVVQCTPDLSQMDCYNCLDQLFEDIPPHQGIFGGRVVAPSCNFRYETFLFYGPTYYALPPTSLAPPPPFIDTAATQANKNTSKTFGTGSLVITGASVLLIVSVGVYSRVRKGKKNAETIGCVGFLGFEFSSIKAATNNFSERNKIGQSTVGAVYKGRLSKGQEIAVKSYPKNIGQHHMDYFENDVLFGARFFHRNLVKFYGICSSGDERFLVYEFVPTSLDRLLFDPIGRKDLTWDKRYKIIHGIVTALLYLHGDCGLTIIHGDIKASKVLLDGNLNPKISTFGNAKYFGVDRRDRATTRVVGTLGYLDPEYVYSGEITVKSDVYSFGVLLLEIISGQRSGSFWREHEETFVSYVRRNWREETISNIVDPQISISNGTSEYSEIARCIQIGLHCAQPRSRDRPTMSSVERMLNMRDSTLSDLPGVIWEFHDNHGFIRELDDSSSSDLAELSDHSRNSSFVSATETSLSPISEISFHENEPPRFVEREPVQLRSRFLASLGYVHSRVVGSLRSWKIFGNSQACKHSCRRSWI